MLHGPVTPAGPASLLEEKRGIHEIPVPCPRNSSLKVNREQNRDLSEDHQLSPPNACSITSIFQLPNFPFSICKTRRTATLPFPFAAFFFLTCLKTLRSNLQRLNRVSRP